MRSALLPTAARTSLKQSKSQVSPTFASKSWVRKANTSLKLRVKLATQPYQLDGVAIDAEKQRLYVLAVGERKGEGAQPVFDPEAPVAAELYAFSTTALEPATGTDAGLLAGETTLGALSEEAGVPLLDPHGIAVDPTTHDVLILGQQDESKKKGEEELRAAVQRVHTEGAAEGELGPRYVDTENCLDEGEAIEAEPACAEGSGQPTSPFVSPGGRVYGMRAGELWEIPASEGAAEAFASRPKAYEAKSKRLFTIGRGQGIAGEEGIVEPLVESEQGGALAFVPTGPASGRIYLDAEITAEEGGGTVSKNKGAAVLGYDEDGGTPSARELGWTAGQNGTSEDEKCLLPLGNGQLLLGADGTGRLLLFDVTTSPATVNVLQFGAGGEECGHARATPPKSPTQITNHRRTRSTNTCGSSATGLRWKAAGRGNSGPNTPTRSKDATKSSSP